MKKIAVIGSGLMGRGIAYAAAQIEFQVHLQDIQPKAFEKAEGLYSNLK